MKFVFKNSNSKKNLKKYKKLYVTCFQDKKYKLDYLNWLYNKNPEGRFIGIDVFHNKKIIGQVGGIPQTFIYKKQKEKGIISINVCVNPKYQNKGLFSELTKKFEKIVKKKKINLIVGIANKNATHGWIKSINMKFQFSLDGYIFFNLKKFSNFSMSNLNFYRFWNKKNFTWRSQNPNNKIFSFREKNNFFSYTNSSFKFLKVIAIQKKIINKNYLKKKSFLFMPKLFIGSKPNNQGFFKIHIPKFLKPSPLNVLIKHFKNKKFKLVKNKTYLTFLDFDAF